MHDKAPRIFPKQQHEVIYYYARGSNPYSEEYQNTEPKSKKKNIYAGIQFIFSASRAVSF